MHSPELDALYTEAAGLIQEIGEQPDPDPLAELEEYWGRTLAGFGEDWEDVLDELLRAAEAASAEDRPFHHNAHMYWLVLDRCYERMKEEEIAFHRELFDQCLVCLRSFRADVLNLPL